MSANGKRPAFPTQHVANGNTVEGLTKRELFAAMAMQGMLANNKIPDSCTKLSDSRGSSSVDIMAAIAVGQADALLRKLEEGK